MKVEILKETKTKGYFVIPEKPSSGQLSDEDLARVVGGKCDTATSSE
jgi:hypothetical protein